MSFSLKIETISRIALFLAITDQEVGAGCTALCLVRADRDFGHNKKTLSERPLATPDPNHRAGASIFSLLYNAGLCVEPQTQFKTRLGTMAGAVFVPLPGVDWHGLAWHGTSSSSSLDHKAIGSMECVCVCVPRSEVVAGAISNLLICLNYGVFQSSCLLCGDGGVCE